MKFVYTSKIYSFFFLNLSHLRQVYLVVSKQQQEEAHSSFPAILFRMKSFEHAKSMERADLWDRYNLYVAYAFGSAHVKVQRMNRSRTFAVPFDWRSRIERWVDPNTNLSILTDSNVDLYMRRTK